MFPTARDLGFAKATTPASIHRHSIEQNETNPDGNEYDTRHDGGEKLEEPHTKYRQTEEAEMDFGSTDWEVGIHRWDPDAAKQHDRSWGGPRLTM